jgi:hypothetical protein
MDRIGTESVSRLIWGIFLIAVGALLLAVNLGLEVPRGVWNYWPFLLIAMGAAKMAFGGERGSGGGFWLLLAGLYGWISIWRLWGLSWETAWPIFVIAGGLSIVFRSTGSRRARRGRRGRRLDDGGDPVGTGQPRGVDHAG